MSKIKSPQRRRDAEAELFDLANNFAEAGPKLLAEAKRFEQLAARFAVEILREPANPNNDEKRTKALLHLVRAETFKAAAQLIS